MCRSDALKMLAQGSSFGSYCSFVEFSRDVVSSPYLITCILVLLGSHTDLSCKLEAITIEKKGSEIRSTAYHAQLSKQIGRARMYIFFAGLSKV